MKIDFLTLDTQVLILYLMSKHKKYGVKHTENVHSIGENKQSYYDISPSREKLFLRRVLSTGAVGTLVDEVF